MKWRVLLELTEANGNVEARELATGHRPTSAIAAEAVGLTLARASQFWPPCRLSWFKPRPINIVIIGGFVRIVAPVAPSRTGALGS